MSYKSTKNLYIFIAGHMKSAFLAHLNIRFALFLKIYDLLQSL